MDFPFLHFNNFHFIVDFPFLPFLVYCGFSFIVDFLCSYIYHWHRSALNSRVGPTGFLQSDDDAKLKIDEF